MSISANGRVCGLLAYPIGHSLSPDMHNFFSERQNIDEVYVPFMTPPKGLADAVKGAYAMNVLGMNVTIPHKVNVMKYVSSLDDSAKLVGAVNTLVRTEEGFCGYNTDLYGLTRSIKEAGVLLADAKVLLLGAGGAAAAAAAMCVNEGCRELIIINRSADKAEALSDRANNLSGRNFARALTYERLSEIPGYGDASQKNTWIVIQATNCGMSPAVNEAPVYDPFFYDLAGVAVDIIFNPAMTLFMKMAQEHGAKVIGGLRMLLYQGVKSYELWNDVVIGQDTADEAYALMEDALKKRNAL